MSTERWNRLEQLFAAARRESPPPLDVTRAVLGRIAQPSARPAAVDRTLAWCALGSVAAAGVVSIAASTAFLDLMDPLNDLMQSCDLVLR